MIDRASRDRAAYLVRQFRDGQITSDDLESDWPGSRSDKSLEAIGSMVWRFYDDHRPRRMVGNDAADPYEREELTRYAAFLDTDFEYEWPKTNFCGLGGLGVLTVLSLGLLWPLDWWIKRRNRRSEDKLKMCGDLDVWPFIRRADHAGRAGDV